MTESSIHQQIRTQEKEPIRKQDAKRNNQSTPSMQNLHSMKSKDKRAETRTSFDMSRKPKSKDQTKALNIPFTLTIKSSTTCVTLHNTSHCGNDKLTPTLVGIVSVFQNRRSTLLLPFHSVSSAYLPPPMGTLIGMFNAWVWSLAIVTAKASCTRFPLVRVNGMFNALVWSFDFGLRDMSNEVRVFSTAPLEI
jgi:hypothetical protein